MRIIKAIKKEIDNSEEHWLKYVCEDANVSYRTVYKALYYDTDIKESTLLKLLNALNMSFEIKTNN
jgi:DNA-binding phage protein